MLEIYHMTGIFGVVMKIWLMFLICATFVSTAFAQHAFTPGEIAEGGRLFQSNCTGCHGPAAIRYRAWR